MAKVISLKGEERLGRGKGPSRALRREKMIPATIYGRDKTQVMFSLPEKEVTLEYLKGGFLTHLVDLEVSKVKYKVLPKHIQLHPVTDAIIHIDFVYISENDKIKVVVPVHLINKDKCLGVKQGGSLNSVRHNVEILCGASSIPEYIEYDVAEMQIGSSLHASDLVLPKNVELVTEKEATIATITGRASEEAAGEAK